MPRHTPALALICALLAGCGPSAPPAGSGSDAAPARSGPEIGLVYDAGGRGDKSFNDAAYAGMTRAKQELGLKVKDIEPSETTSKEAALRALAERQTPLILGIGILFSAEITRIAEEYPALRFVCIDYVPPAGYGDGGKPVPANLLGVSFREHEGGYLVGAIAALNCKSKKLGFVGGMDIPLIRRFLAGFTAGAQAIDPAIEVLADFAGNTPEAWKNPTRGKALALAQFERGVDVILHASGSTGLGVFAAAREQDKLAIGVDMDQSAEAPDHVITSMVKRVDEAVYRAITAYKDGSFAGGVQSLGLKEGGLAYVATEQNARWVTPAVVARVDALKAKIIAGEIVVPEK